MAIILDATATKTASGVSSYTWTHTCTGSDLILVVGIAWSAQDAGINIASVTYNGVALTKQAGLVSDRDRCELWYLVAPATGANSVVVTNGGAGSKNAQAAIGSVSYINVNQDDPIRGSVTQAGSGTSITKDITSATGDLVVDVLHADDNGGGLSLAPGSGQAERWNIEFDFNIEGAGSDEVGAATVTMSWTSSSADLLQLCAMALRPATTAARGRIVKYLHNTFTSRNLGRPVILDILGRQVPLEQLEVDQWMRTDGPFFPTSRKFASSIEDPATSYLESLRISEGKATIETSKESLLESLFRRLGRST